MSNPKTRVIPPSARASWAQSSPNWCAVCVSEEGPFVRRPLGRNGELVNVCSSCDTEHPRSGRYAFDGGQPSNGMRAPGPGHRINGKWKR